MRPNEKLDIGNYTYILPDEKIAKYPLHQRDESRLLVYKNSNIAEKRFREIVTEFPADHLLVFNNTKVIQARLEFFKTTGARIEIFCLEPLDPADFNLAFQQEYHCRWKCTVGNMKKWKSGSLFRHFVKGNDSFILEANIAEILNGYAEIEFSWGKSISFGEILDATGIIPIPPYLKRQAEENDKDTYQTVYSNHKGSVAAPTAGLHFTTNLLSKLDQKGIKRENITLHVGAGTFKPVKTNDARDHEMHEEHFFVHRNTILKLISQPENITAVGTTSVRTLETLYWLGVKLIKNGHGTEIPLQFSQWEYNELDQQIPRNEALQELVKYLESTGKDAFEAITRIMIAPGYNFRITNSLITNFHQPGSTLLLLIAAFVGDDWKKIYNYALQHDFRFLSYGDSSLLFRNT
ncbi:MAG TPA: S-adenosylmethionine:tRNA ribosyltransferase-isomerase [Bacteroidales bacterium]|nr:S-adenosylmethionine:tRNA ribosyltransferase-isomerase [Bacteroidales bacterium]